MYYIKWGFESRLKQSNKCKLLSIYYIKWGFESRLKLVITDDGQEFIISNGELRVD